MLKSVLVTGGAGFIGSNFVRYLLDLPEFDGQIVNIDKLTYAGNLGNLRGIEEGHDQGRHSFKQIDICDPDALEEVFRKNEIDTVVHFAAESHVDRSIVGPRDFVETNVVGTFTLLDAARSSWLDRKDVRFHHISTDEVFGSLGNDGRFRETTPYDPRSPYSASKAASDHFVRAYHHTYGLPVTISNSCNNFGPYQFPEKLIPLVILNAIDHKELPVYGDGRHVRDWLYVEDHVSAIWQVLLRGEVGQTYNVGAQNEWSNIDLVRLICRTVAKVSGQPEDAYYALIRFVEDRPGHDRRYAVDSSKLREHLDWQPAASFEIALEKTVRWYMENPDWVRQIQTGAYAGWVDLNYGNRIRRAAGTAPNA